MRATLTFVRECYARFNAECFASALPPVTLRLSSSLRTLGSLRHPRTVTDATTPADFTLSVSNRLDMERSIIEDTVIHELIHLYILWFRLRDRSAHGPVFRQMMQAINRRHGRHVTVSHRCSETEKASDRLRRHRIVIVSLFEGTRCVTVCTPAYAPRIISASAMLPGVFTEGIYSSDDPVFAHYPSSRTPKFYRISPTVLDKVLASAIPVEITGGRFRRKR